MTTLRATFGPTWTPDAPVAMLLMHGYGSNEHDLTGLDGWLPQLPWASLRAPIEMGYGAAAWFPLPTLETMNSLDATPIEQATAAVWEWVDAEVGTDTLLVPLGFSQGGLMATQLLRTRPERIAATVVLAGLVLDADQPADEQLAENRPAVFWGRGDADQVITSQAIAVATAWLRDHSDLTERVYPGLAHSVNDTELADVRTFVDAALSARDSS